MNFFGIGSSGCTVSSDRLYPYHLTTYLVCAPEPLYRRILSTKNFWSWGVTFWLDFCCKRILCWSFSCSCCRFVLVESVRASRLQSILSEVLRTRRLIVSFLVLYYSWRVLMFEAVTYCKLGSTLLQHYRRQLIVARDCWRRYSRPAWVQEYIVQVCRRRVWIIPRICVLLHLSPILKLQFLVVFLNTSPAATMCPNCSLEHLCLLSEEKDQLVDDSKRDCSVICL